MLRGKISVLDGLDFSGKMKNCEYLGKGISSPLMLGGRYTPRQWSCCISFQGQRLSVSSNTV